MADHVNHANQRLAALCHYDERVMKRKEGSDMRGRKQSRTGVESSHD
jgi:hypothetical protein